MSTTTAQPPTLGHVHLKVADLDRAVAFYRDVIGLDVQARMGEHAAFLASGGYHHHLGLNTWHSAGEDPAPKRKPGLFHTAFLYPDQASLAHAVRRVIEHGVQIYGAADHGVSLAVYFDDPDGNGVELYWDKPESAWEYLPDGSIKLVNDRFDVSPWMSETLSD